MNRSRWACIGLLLLSAPVARGATYVTSSDSTTPRALEERFAEVVNVKDFGAKGTGVDDTNAIQAAVSKIKAQQGGTLFFPDGEYHVQFQGTANDGDALFGLPSNTRVLFAARASINPEPIAIVNPDKPPHLGLFGVHRVAVAASLDPEHPASMLPVTNLTFEGLRVHSPSPVGASMSGLSPVHLMVQPQDDNNSITNVRISNCDFDTGLGIYIVNGRQATAGDDPLDRQVRGVKISNCRITNNGTITADGRDVEIINLTAEGTNSKTTTYDAISIHNGVNVRIHGGDFSGFGGSGNAIMIRNNGNTGRGTNGVVISGASFHDIPTDRAAISVVLAAAEPQGVQNIAIANNTFTNVVKGIHFDTRLVRTSVPFRNIAISGNVFGGGNRAILAEADPTYLYMWGLSITGNTINTATDAQAAAVQLSGVQLASLTGNFIAQNSGKPAVLADFLEYSTFCGNTVVSSAGTTLSMTNLRSSAVSGNMIYGPYTIESAPSMDNVYSTNAPMR